MSIIERQPQTQVIASDEAALKFAEKVANVDSLVGALVLPVTTELIEPSGEDLVKAKIEAIYPEAVVDAQFNELLTRTNFIEKLNGRTWGVLAIRADSQDAVIPKKVELTRFANYFGVDPSAHVDEYAEFDSSGVFALVINASDPENPVPTGTLRIIKPSEIGFKTMNVLGSSDETVNPWYSELSRAYGPYDDSNKQEVIAKMMVDFGLEGKKTWDVAAMAITEEFAGSHGSFGETTFAMYIACMALAEHAGVDAYVNFQDVVPLEQMQTIFDEPWVIPVGLSPKNYEGPYPALPAVLPDLEGFKEKLRLSKPEVAELLLDEATYSATYALPGEFQTTAELDEILA